MTARRLRMGAAAVLLAGGLVGFILGLGIVASGWYSARTWAASEEAEVAARNLDTSKPRWVESSEAIPTLRPTATPRPSSTAPATAIAVPAAQPAGGTATAAISTPTTQPNANIAEPTATSAATVEPTEEPTPTATPEPRAAASEITLADSGFRFLDPPEPGAQAIISLDVQNASALPTDALQVVLSTRWLTGWKIVAADPPVQADRVEDGNQRIFEFPGLDPESETTLQLHLVATDDAVDPPELTLRLSNNEEIGRARPQTVSPRPNPGPARAIEIPRLHLRAAVVQTVWEPPAFVVGQLKGTANLSEGNTVLIGHLNGLAGNVFANLAELEPGDEVIATSRGLDYRFVISEVVTLPGDDSIPIQPTDEPRLTLMTCTGDWDPIGHDYSHRLWVVAEPAELAEQTLNGETPGPLTRQLGLDPELTILPPDDPGPSPKEQPGLDAEQEEEEGPPTPSAVILAPEDGAPVDSQVTISGRRTDDADPDAPLWLVVRAEIEGSRWYLYGKPLEPGDDGEWAADLELGGGPGIHHTIVVAAVDKATDARLRRHAREHRGEPLSLLPDAFEAGARITVERR
ncbi:MAG: sortase [Chloroflexota bacterium]